MRVLRDPAEAVTVEDAVLRRYCIERFEGMVEEGEHYDPLTHGVLVIVDEFDDPSQSVDVLDGFDLLADSLGQATFGSPDYISPYAGAIDHGAFWEVVLLGSDGGDFTAILVPKRPGVDARLQALCSALAAEGGIEL